MSSFDLQIQTNQDVDTVQDGQENSLNDQPPSIVAIRPLETSHVSGTHDYYADSDQPLSTSAMRPVETSKVSGTHDYYADSDQPLSTSAVRPLNSSQLSDDLVGEYSATGKPPSIVDVRTLNISETSSGGDEYNYRHPPSAGQVRPSENSQTGNPIPVAAPEMSSTAPKIKLKTFHANIL